MGAEMEAAVTMATVPDPWMRRTRVATMKGSGWGDGQLGDLLGQLLACTAVAQHGSPAPRRHRSPASMMPADCSPSSRRAAVARLSMCGTRV